MSNKAGKGTQFVIGGVAGCMSTCIVQPIDLIKTRMQITGKDGVKFTSSFDCAKQILKNEGASGFYKGLTAALFRQATYTSGRFGVYNWVSEYLQGDKKDLSFLLKIFSGVVAGAAGAIIGTPAEVALIRMTTDGRLPIDQRRNYKHVFDCLGKVIKEEGTLTMWRGATPTIIRAMVLNGAQLAVYAQAKQVLMKNYSNTFKEGIFTHIVASTIAGFVCTVCSLPVDLTKTRLQMMKVVDGKPEYTGAIDCMVKAIKNEGVLSLWKGFTPYFLKVGPHTILTFIFVEQMNKIYTNLKSNKKI